MHSDNGMYCLEISIFWANGFMLSTPWDGYVPPQYPDHHCWTVVNLWQIRPGAQSSRDSRVERFPFLPGVSSGLCLTSSARHIRPWPCEPAEIYKLRSEGFNVLLSIVFSLASQLWHLVTYKEPATLRAAEIPGFLSWCLDVESSTGRWRYGKPPA